MTCVKRTSAMTKCLSGSAEFTARSNPLMARLHLPGAVNLTVIRRPEANRVAIGHHLRWWAAWVAVTLTEPIEEAVNWQPEAV